MTMDQTIISRKETIFENVEDGRTYWSN